MVLIRIASTVDIKSLSRKLLAFVADRRGQFYQDNIAKFGIPEEYGEKVFSEGSMLKAAQERGSTFYLATEGEEILGFAQVNPENPESVELDRMVVFPQYARRGIGTSLLQEAIMDQRRKGVRTMLVSAGKEESHARRFYEKNGFHEIKQATLETPWGSRLDLVTYERPL